MMLIREVIRTSTPSFHKR